jgi:hypothetical protein
MQAAGGTALSLLDLNRILPCHGTDQRSIPVVSACKINCPTLQLSSTLLVFFAARSTAPSKKSHKTKGLHLKLVLESSQHLIGAMR